MSSNIYQIGFDFSYALADIAKQKSNICSIELFDNTPELFDQFEYEWNTEESTQIPNLILIMSKLLGVSSEYYSTIAHVVSPIKTKLVDIGGKSYNIFTEVRMIKSALNLRKSKLTRFSTGDILSVDSPVFLPQNYPPLFKIEEAPTTFFCSELLYDEIIANKLQGWKFKACPIKDDSWFKF